MWELCTKNNPFKIQEVTFSCSSWSTLSLKSPWQQCLSGTSHTPSYSVLAAQHLITPLYFNSFWIMYFRVQLFHLDNITIHLGFFLFSFFIRATEFFIFGGSTGGWEKIIFNKQISDKSGTVVSYASNRRKTVFHMASTADSCLPCCGKLSRGSVVYASKTNSWSFRVALPLWFYDWSV